MSRLIAITTIMPTKLATGVLYSVYLLASAWSVLAILELVTHMGHGSGMYSDYGRNPREVATAFGFLVVLLIWLLTGTTIAVQVLRGHLRLRHLGAATAITLFIIAPVTLLYLLGVGHS